MITVIVRIFKNMDGNCQGENFLDENFLGEGGFARRKFDWWIFRVGVFLIPLFFKELSQWYFGGLCSKK